MLRPGDVGVMMVGGGAGGSYCSALQAWGVNVRSRCSAVKLKVPFIH